MHLLLLHGAIGAASQMKTLADELEKDFTVHTPDFPGHGNRPFPAGPYAIELFAADVLRYIDDLRLDRVAIFGYSMGGYVGMYLARHHSTRICKLATLATKFQWDPAIALRETKMINPEKIREKVPAFAQILEERHQPKDWKLVLMHTAALLTALGDNPPLTAGDWPGIKVPALLLLGDSDKMVTLEETEAVYKGIPGARWEILPQTPHPIEQVDTMMLASRLHAFYQE